MWRDETADRATGGADFESQRIPARSHKREPLDMGQRSRAFCSRSPPRQQAAAARYAAFDIQACGVDSANVTGKKADCEALLKYINAPKRGD